MTHAHAPHAHAPHAHAPTAHASADSRLLLKRRTALFGLGAAMSLAHVRFARAASTG
jgi:hypothetical protein